MNIFSFFKRKKAAPAIVPPGDWNPVTPCTLLQVSRILNQPSNQTLKELPAHAERVMVELLERRERDREK